MVCSSALLVGVAVEPRLCWGELVLEGREKDGRGEEGRWDGGKG